MNELRLLLLARQLQLKRRLQLRRHERLRKPRNRPKRNRGLGADVYKADQRINQLPRRLQALYESQKSLSLWSRRRRRKAGQCADQHDLEHETVADL
jgi:hypothetical protein